MIQKATIPLFARVLAWGRTTEIIVLQGTLEIPYLIHGPHFTDEETDVQKDYKLPKDTKLRLENSCLTPNPVLFLHCQTSFTSGTFLSLGAKLDLSENKHSNNSNPLLRSGKHDLQSTSEGWFGI